MAVSGVIHPNKDKLHQEREAAHPVHLRAPDSKEQMKVTVSRWREQDRDMFRDIKKRSNLKKCRVPQSWELILDSIHQAARPLSKNFTKKKI